MKRTFEQIKEHYEIEKKLAYRLKHSEKEERKYLYTFLYDELFRKIPHHPQLIRKKDFSLISWFVRTQLFFLKRFLRNDAVFVEIGAGDCNLSFNVCKIVKKVYAVDVSAVITKAKKIPKNFELIISDGSSIPLKNSSVDVVYSNQLMEHLHPSDAIEQLINIKDILIKGGKYICITPNRLNGPHDISKYFDDVSKGFHLKEYTFIEINKLFENIGFSFIYGYWGLYGLNVRIPLRLIFFVESIIDFMPTKIRRWKLFKLILDIKIIGVK